MNQPINTEVTLKDWLNEQPFTLTMSSGFFGFFAHLGMLSALESQGLQPTRLTGSSAGALIAAGYAAGLSTDQLKQSLFQLQKNDFWDPFLGLGLLRGKKFRRLLSEMLKKTCFEDCNTPLAVSVFDGLSRKTKVLEKGPLIEAVYASCAVPFLFQPMWMHGRPFWDGGIKDRPGLAGTKSQERIFYHHIASVSPWRKAGSKALQIPKRANLTALVLHDLPRSGPDKLALGPEITALAETKTLKALESVALNGRVEIST